MKIKFIKEYVAVDPVPTSGIIHRYHRYRVGETKEITPYTAQWLIDNGFAEEVKESGWWKPKNGVDYYYVNDAGAVVSREGFLSMSTTDDKRVDIGNAFRSKAAAERYRDYLKAVTTVRQDEGVLTPEQIRDEYQDRFIHYIGFYQDGQLDVSWKSLCDDIAIANVIYFDTMQHAQTSLDKHPDEWKIIANYDWSRE